MSDTHSLITVLSRLPDPRLERSKEHELTDLLVIAACSAASGCEPGRKKSASAWTAWMPTAAKPSAA